jgi:UDP-glucose 4-epimerase
MKVLLTGGAGFIGSHTAIELLNSGFEVIIVDDLSNSKPLVIDRIRRITGKEVSFYETDASDYDAMDRIFRQEAPSAVIHFAGFKAVGESVARPLSYYDNNLNTTLTTLKVMAAHGVRKFVFSSSATVYGVPEQVPLTETMKTGCTNPYGWTKLMIEQILTDVAATGAIEAVLLRYFNPIGAHESGLIGEDPSGIPNNLLPYITQVAIGKLPELRVFGNDYNTPDGTGVRDYIHVVDLAKGHVSALRYLDRVGQGDSDSASGVGAAGVGQGNSDSAAGVGAAGVGQGATGFAEIFNLGTGNGVSVLEMISAFQRVNNVKIPYTIADRRAGDIAQCYADASKAQTILGWTAEKSLDDMCRDSWRWQTENPDGYSENK